MAVRSFDYEQAKSTMNSIQTKASEVQKILNTCQNIVDDNVGVENRWSGERATDFKAKWERAAADFNSFVQMINNYASRIDESYKTHKEFDETV